MYSRVISYRYKFTSVAFATFWLVFKTSSCFDYLVGHRNRQRMFQEGFLSLLILHWDFLYWPAPCFESFIMDRKQLKRRKHVNNCSDQSCCRGKQVSIVFLRGDALARGKWTVDALNRGPSFGLVPKHQLFISLHSCCSTQQFLQQIVNCFFTWKICPSYLKGVFRLLRYDTAWKQVSGPPNPRRPVITHTLTLSCTLGTTYTFTKAN